MVMSLRLFVFLFVCSRIRIGFCVLWSLVLLGEYLYSVVVFFFFVDVKIFIKFILCGIFFDIMIF